MKYLDIFSILQIVFIVLFQVYAPFGVDVLRWLWELRVGGSTAIRGPCLGLVDEAETLQTKLDEENFSRCSLS